METEEFNALVNGPLKGPTVLSTINRLAMALAAVVRATGKAGEDALRAHCKARQKRDADTSGVAW